MAFSPGKQINVPLGRTVGFLPDPKQAFPFHNILKDIDGGILPFYMIMAVRIGNSRHLNLKNRLSRELAREECNDLFHNACFPQYFACNFHLLTYIIAVYFK